MDSEQFTRLAALLGVQLDESQLSAFKDFEDAIYDANQVQNLTRVPQGEAWIRHFLDSILIQDLIPESSGVLDLGTGPGFPAWPLACARPDLNVTAIDSNGKMLAFLRSQPLPNLTVVQVRAEDWNVRDRFDIVTGRALAPLVIQLELSAAPCKVGGRVIPMRTLTDRESLKPGILSKLGLRLADVMERPLPGSNAVRLLPVYDKVAATQRGYPRRWSEIKRR